MIYTCNEGHVDNNILRVTCQEWHMLRMTFREWYIVIYQEGHFECYIPRLTCWECPVESEELRVRFLEWHVKNGISKGHVKSDISRVICQDLRFTSYKLDVICLSRVKTQE